MPKVSDPIVDARRNPFYCPDVPASVYITSMRQKLRSTLSSRSRRHSKSAVSSYTRSVLLEFLQNHDQEQCVNFGTPKGSYLYPSDMQDSFTSTLMTDDLETTFIASRSATVNLPVLSPPLLPILPAELSTPAHRRRRRSSLETLVDAALDLEKTKNLSKYVKESEENPVVPNDFLNFHLGSESRSGLEALVSYIDSTLPGIRLRERLLSLSDLSHQTIIDYLGDHGLLNERILQLFRTSEIENLSLTNTLLNEDGLNIGRSGVLSMLSKPSSFTFLSVISFTGTPLLDFDLVKLHGLPRLSTLYLNATGISNEAVFLLLPLKRTLRSVSLASNPKVTDEAVAALILLYSLGQLSILDTSIGMTGLRRLASMIYNQEWIIDVEIPRACEDYIDHMHDQYMLHISPPFVSDPSVCSTLSAAALKRNLEAHSNINSEILAGGTRMEMVERLQFILETRAADNIVRSMVLGDEVTD